MSLTSITNRLSAHESQLSFLRSTPPASIRSLCRERLSQVSTDNVDNRIDKTGTPGTTEETATDV